MYAYDALNHRTQDGADRSYTLYMYDLSGHRVQTYNGNNGSLIKIDVYWGNRFIAAYTGGQVYFQHSDVLGTVCAVTNSSGSTAGTFSSLPFGDGYTPSGTDVDALHFSELDHDTSHTEHAQFRQYNSAQGRWMSPDPYSGSYHWRNPQSFNRYTYALNNPLAFMDPSGLDLEPWCDEAGENCDSGSYESDENYGGGDTGCADGGACIVDAGAGGSVTVTATPDPDPEPIGSGICLGSCGVSEPDQELIHPKHLLRTSYTR